MKLKRRTMVRAVCLILCLASCMLVAPSCKRSDSDLLANNAFVSLTPDGDKLEAVVTANNRILDQRKNEKLYLYELLPGEDLATALTREPVSEKKLSSRMEFSFSLMDGERSRIYSSFVAAFSDGTALLPDGYFTDTPSLAAADKSPFLWGNSPKGLCSTNVEEALDFGVMHTMYELRLSELIGGGDGFVFCDVSYPYSGAVLSALDVDIFAAAEAGMQVSLMLIPDAVLSDAAAAAMCELLCARYEGKLSALIIGDAEGRTPQYAARLIRYGNLALRSRMANARIYLLSPTGSVDSAKTFYSDTVIALTPGGIPAWNAMLALSLGDEQTLTPANITDVSDYALNEIGTGRAERVAVYLPKFSSKKPDFQAAQLAYAYRLALTAGVGLIYYPSTRDDNTGLFSSAGERRVAADIFQTLDTGLSEELDMLCCEELMNSEDNVRRIDYWNMLQTPGLISRELVTGNAHVGTVGFPEDPLFDFTTGELLGFTGAGSHLPPESKQSEHWKKPVLYTWLNPANEYPTGVRKLLGTSEELSGASSLSVHLLTQANAQNVTARLCMEGTSTEGKRLSYEASVVISDGQWQVVTFQISSFVASLDPTKPCTLTLTAEPDTESEKPFGFWVRGIDIRRPEDAKPSSALLGIILGGVSLTFALVFSVYIVTVKRQRKQ